MIDPRCVYTAEAIETAIRRPHSWILECQKLGLRVTTVAGVEFVTGLDFLAFVDAQQRPVSQEGEA